MFRSLLIVRSEVLLGFEDGMIGMEINVLMRAAVTRSETAAPGG